MCDHGINCLMVGNCPEIILVHCRVRDVYLPTLCLVRSQYNTINKTLCWINFSNDLCRTYMAGLSHRSKLWCISNFGWRRPCYDGIGLCYVLAGYGRTLEMSGMVWCLLHLLSSSNVFHEIGYLWMACPWWWIHLIFVSEIRWLLCIYDAEQSSNF